MRGLLSRLILNTLALWLVSLLYPGVAFAPGAGVVDYLVAGAIWGLANALLRPLFLFLTLPLNLLTFGLFTWVVNGVLLYLVAQATALEVRGFLEALLGAFLLSLVSLFLNWLFRD